MKPLPAVIILFLFCNKHFIHGFDKFDSFSLLKSNSTSEQKVWNIKLDIDFPKSLAPIVKRPPGADVRFKCEAIMKFTKVEKKTKNKEGIETLLTETPPDYIQQTLMKNLKVYWVKDNKTLSDNNKLKTATKIDKRNGTIGTYLRIKNIDKDDAGIYNCVIKQNHEKKQFTELKVIDDKDVIDNYEIPTYSSLFPDADSNTAITLNVNPTSVLMSENLKSQDNNLTNKALALNKFEPICQEYVGQICNKHLSGNYVYIPYDTSLQMQEEKLLKAIQVTQFSNEISSQCEGYALPSLCYSTFPICRDPFVTNDNFFKQVKQISALHKVYSQSNNTGNVADINSLMESLDYRHNSTVLRRVCKQDCEILENELCQTEYAIAKRHPHIGKQLTLEECSDLPDDDVDCLKIGIGTVMVSDDECYWENGAGYLGRISTADNGLPCMEWSKQLLVKVYEFPELAGRHSYCRNPNNTKKQPWCVVDKNGKTEQLCDIPKCAHRIWIYIVLIFVFITLTVIGFIICLCSRNKHKGNAAAIRDINLPNADKNIYGNSRLNSPVEMNELSNNPNMTNQPHLVRNTRSNNVLRIPQYTLSQIKFLEELGEGAFGKVYKGAIKLNGENLFVAVKALKENASAKTKADFRREIDLISELTHDNIVCIVGVALKEEPLCMLFEFMARGDLHEFLMGRAPPSGKGLPPMRLLNIAQNIASGMQYLASHHYVHRDLAARNCLVSDDFVVKISDFGLSRDIYSSDYYRVQSKSLLPVRWMPPESILYGKFTTESDIWSYGVVLWEIYSYGLQPYYGYSNQEVIAMVRGGELLASPSYCPPAMYALMRDCWKHAPQRRPNFDDIVIRLQDWIQMGGCPETAPSESGSSGCGHRTIGSTRDLQERVPLLPPHCSSSNGSIATSSLKKFSLANSTGRVADDNSSTCSEVPPLAPKSKKHSSGSLIDTDKVGTRETVVRIPNTAQFCNDI